MRQFLELIDVSKAAYPPYGLIKHRPKYTSYVGTASDGHTSAGLITICMGGNPAIYIESENGANKRYPWAENFWEYRYVDRR